MTPQSNTMSGLWRPACLIMALGTITPLLFAVAVYWVVWRPARGRVDVAFSLVPVSLPHYDDGDGRLPLCVVMQLTNVSDDPVWICGLSGSPAHVDEQLINGKWDSNFGWVSSRSGERFPEERGILRSGESVLLTVGPVAESASEVRVGVPIILQESGPAEIHWVYCCPVQIKKHGKYYWPDFKSATRQVEKVLPYGEQPLLESGKRK
jgi:hypothetical protein